MPKQLYDRYDAIVPAPFGAVGVCLNDNQTEVVEVVYLPADAPTLAGEGSLSQRAFEQLAAYFKNPKSPFDLPLAPAGTEFQNKVWRSIDALECGQVLTYKQVGQIIGCGSPRAVGGACGANPYVVITPCHRVVAADGIGGFARHDSGFHVNIKRWLLEHEGVNY